MLSVIHAPAPDSEYAFARGACFSADGERVYVVDEEGGCVRVLSRADGSLQRTIGGAPALAPAPAPTTVVAAAPPPPPGKDGAPTFVAAASFDGPRAGFEFKTGDLGVGYYSVSAAAAAAAAAPAAAPAPAPAPRGP